MAKSIKQALTDLLIDIYDLICNSHGVAGLHKNGDLAPWEELLEGGEYSAWLGDNIAEARSALETQTVHGLPDDSNLLALCADLANKLREYDSANPYKDCAELLARADAAIAEARAALEATEGGAVALSERPWERPGWCNPEGYCWIGCPEHHYPLGDTGDYDILYAQWRLELPPSDQSFPLYTHSVSLPASALPTPAANKQP